MGLREVLRFRHTEDGHLPKPLRLVVAIESLASIFGLADVNDRLCTVIVFVCAEQETDARQVQFLCPVVRRLADRSEPFSLSQSSLALVCPQDGGFCRTYHCKVAANSQRSLR